MKRILLRGLFAVLPLLLSIYVVWWLVQSVERTTFSLLSPLLPEEYRLPGTGLVVFVALIFVAGLILSNDRMRQLFDWAERKLRALPVVSSVYGAFRDFVEYFDEDASEKFSQTVLVECPPLGGKLIGFVTSDTVQDLIERDSSPDTVAVYLPMSYQLGGYTLIIPRSEVSVLDIETKKAMTLVLTAGMSAKSKGAGASKEDT